MAEKNAPRPLLDAIDERDTIDRARSTLARERVQAMEAALETIGFGNDTLTGSLARLLALVADGWQPIAWSWDRLINDPKLNWAPRRSSGRRSAAAVRKNRIDSLRRSLRDLAEFGLLEWSAEDAGRRRGYRSETQPVIRLRREVITAEAAGNLVCQSPAEDEKETQNQTNGLATDLATDSATDSATDLATTQRQEGPTPYNPFTLKEPSSPFNGATAKGLRQKDQRKKNNQGRPSRLTIEEVQPTAERLFASLNYEGDEGGTLWRVAAAHVAGALTEAQIASACRGVRSATHRRYSLVGSFRRLLEDICKASGQSLDQQLQAAFIVGGIPKSRPPTAARDPRTLPKPRASPRERNQRTEAATAAARLSVLRTLATLADGEVLDP